MPSNDLVDNEDHLPLLQMPASQEPLVAEGDRMVMASYSLTRDEHRLLIACMEKIHRTQPPMTEGSLQITLTAHEYAECYKLSKKTAYNALQKSSNKLWGAEIRIEEEDGERSIRWLQEKASYQNGRVSLKFSDHVSQHLRSKVTKQTIYRFKQIALLPNPHAIRLFKMFHSVIREGDAVEGRWRVPISVIKDKLQLSSSYDRWIDLRSKILEPSIREINKNTSLEVDWRVSAKEGKRNTEVEFIIFESNQLSLNW